jgi:diaminopimelate epimerase
MTTIPFTKMSGSGNDFIIIDNRRGIMDHEAMPAFVVQACRRRMSVGADGVFFIESSDRVDFKWHFFNADGSRAEMCGNGARCVARFAVLNGIAQTGMAFETDAGIIRATVEGDRVRIRMTDPGDLVPKAVLAVNDRDLEYGAVNTGVPHVVIEVPRVDTVDVVAMGRSIRNHARFAPAGTNVNFVASMDDGRFAIRTYERGVEDETLACGTGNAAAAIVLAARYGLHSPLTFQTWSGCELRIYFKPAEGRFHAVELEGDARVIYEGRLWPEALIYP